MLSNTAPLPGSVRFYSKSPPYQLLTRVLQASKQHAELLLLQSGISECSITLKSSRYGMFDTAAAAADLSSKAWLAGPGCRQEVLRILAGRPNSPSSAAAVTTAASSKTPSRAAVQAAGGGQSEQHGQQLQHQHLSRSGLSAQQHMPNRWACAAERLSLSQTLQVSISRQTPCTDELPSKNSLVRRPAQKLQQRRDPARTQQGPAMLPVVQE